MTEITATRRAVPKSVQALPLHERFRWARKSAGLSHDRLVEKLGRSNRGHLIKIERGDHVPRADLRRAIADATNVPRELLAEDDDEDESEAVRAVQLAAQSLIGALMAAVQRSET